MRPRFPVIFPAYPGYVIPQQPTDTGQGGPGDQGGPGVKGAGNGGAPTPGSTKGPETPTDAATCPTVGRFGNWLRSGDRLILLLDEDETPLDEGAAGTAAAATPDGAPTAGPPGASTEGAQAAPTEGASGAAPEGASGGPTEDAQGELWGRRRRFRAGPARSGTGQSGRWVQQGRSVVVYLDDEVSPGEGEFFEEPLVAQTGAAAAVAAQAQKVAAWARAAIAAEKNCWIQTVLNAAEGESLVVDGIFGPKTSAAVRRFQARHGLTVSGVVNRQTETALIQTALNQITQASLLAVDGIMGVRTRQEIARFQAGANLVADAVVGRKTRAAMVSALGGRCAP